MIKLYPHQRDAVEKMLTGSILCGGVGSGKSLTSLAYFCEKECHNMRYPKNLYIITTARKRDTLEWDRECARMSLTKDPGSSRGGVKVTIDSWNNIQKYISVQKAFFIFDEQRLIGSGTWVKSFLKITRSNSWIMLSATPGDTWSDYIPVFIANGFYKNRTQFLREHVVYNRFSKFPKIDRYVGVKRLEKLRDTILVDMKYQKKTMPHPHIIQTEYDVGLYRSVVKDRWDPIENVPIQNAGSYCYILRRIVNSDRSRVEELRKILIEHPKAIIFYNYNYELDILRCFVEEFRLPAGEWNGNKHSPIPEGDCWVYLVQYTAGCEGWECIDTDTIIFYSPSYSYRQMVQASGRIDRLNTPYHDLHYYIFTSSSTIDKSIRRSLKNRKTFNERKFANF